MQKHPTVTFSKTLSSYLDDKPAPVAVWESKGTKTGDKLMKQMENILKLPRACEETFTRWDGKNRKNSQVWETALSEMMNSNENLNFDIKR